ncbi:PQQ-binding-like beta-propeller repeat protein [bacterium]|nr:PQQ-binding-like beta-propeller repeat protein [bacterium]
MKKTLATLLSIFFLTFFACEGLAEDWPQWRGPNRDGVWHETGIIKTFDSKQLKPKWSAPISHGYNGPTVANGYVYVMDRITEPEESERVLCFDWKTGKEAWKHTYPAAYRIQYGLGPRASVTVRDGKAFSLGAMAHFHCFDAKTGEVLWQKDLLDEYEVRMPTWGISCSPLVYEDLVIVQIGGADGACIIALKTKNGKEQWRAMDDPASYSSPIITRQAGKDVLLCWTGRHIAGLNPKTGEVYWTHPTRPKMMVINTCTPVVDQNRLFLSAFFDGSYMLRLLSNKLGVEAIWEKRGRNEKRTEGLHAMITTPIVEGDYIYGLDSYGQFRCLKASTGERIWANQEIVPYGRWATIHMVRNNDRVWINNENGELIICKLSPNGYREISRAQLIEPTTKQAQRDRPINWSHPAYAYKHIFARSDTELLCVDLSLNKSQ